MKLINAVFVLLLTRSSIYASAIDQQLPNTDEDPETGRTTTTATTITTASSSSGGGVGPSTGSGAALLDDARGDIDGEARHRTKIGHAASTSASSASTTSEEPDHPRHHHRFHRPVGVQRKVDPDTTADVNDGDDRVASDALPLRIYQDRSSSESGMKLMAGEESTDTGELLHGEAGASALDDAGSGGPSKESKRLWGAAAATVGGSVGEGLANAASLSSASSSAATLAASTTSSTTSTTTTQQASGSHKPNPHDESNHNQTRAFVVPKSKLAKTPPDGYELSARVYIDPRDRLAHFDSTPQRIPYWDCGYIGSTTSPLPLKSAYFRHALTGATSWSGTDGKHAVLVVALSPIAMDLNSGETREFGAGSVILLEDVLIAGHKMRPLTSSREGVSVLFLTLPHQFTQTGRDHISLPSSFLKPVHRDDPCPNDHVPGDATQSANDSSSMNATDAVQSMREDGDASDASSIDLMSSSGPMHAFWRPRNVRRGLLGVFGLSLSSLVADFLAKTAPLWLAVGVGGAFFVAAGTWAMAVGGDALWMAIELQLERRRLGATSVDASLILEDDDETEGISIPKI